MQLTKFKVIEYYSLPMISLPWKYGGSSSKIRDIIEKSLKLALFWKQKNVTNFWPGSCPPRIQKFFLQLQKYDFELEYAPGKTMLVSDTLSRSYLSDIKPEFDKDTLIWHVHFTYSNLPISQSRLDHFPLETQNNQILQTLICYIINGWPEKHQILKE